MLSICLSVFFSGIGLFFFCRFASSKRSAFLPPLFVFILLNCTGFYLAADYFTGDGVNEAVVFQLIAGFEGAGLDDYTFLFYMAPLWFLLSVVLFWFLYRLCLSRTYKRNKTAAIIWSLRARTKNLLVPVFFLLAAVIHPFTADMIKLDIVKLVELYSTSSSLVSRDKPTSYQPKINSYIKPTVENGVAKPTNLVFIYLESLERTYFDETRFPGLIKHLRELETESITFTDIRQLWGTGWTVGGMTASQFGIPLVLINSLAGMETFLPKATGIGDILDDEGYHLVYMGGANLDFSGKGKLYKTHGFSEVYGDEELKPMLPDRNYGTGWGLYDDSLYDLAFKKFEQLSQSEEQFGLFLLTIDTHHPNGYISESCRETVYGDGSNEMLNAVARADLMAATFIKKIRASKFAENVTICVVSDHLAMKNSAWDQLEKGERRNLFMIIPPKNENPVRIARSGSTLDTGATLLSCMGFKNAGLGLGRDLLDPESRTFVEEYKEKADSTLRGFVGELVKLWNFPSITGKLTISPDKREVTVNNQIMKIPVLMELDRDLNVTRVRFPIYKKRQLLRDIVPQLLDDQAFIWIDNVSQMDMIGDAEKEANKGRFAFFAGRLGQEKRMVRVFNDGIDILAAEIAEIFSVSDNEIPRDIEKKRQLKLALDSETGQH